jgi:uncharacterized alkaline shock family protein YloU
LYGCETWSLTVKEEHRLRVYDSRVLRKIFGSEGEEVKGVLKVRNKELVNFMDQSPF